MIIASYYHKNNGKYRLFFIFNMWYLVSSIKEEIKWIVCLVCYLISFLKGM